MPVGLVVTSLNVSIRKRHSAGYTGESERHGGVDSMPAICIIIRHCVLLL